MKRKNIRTMIVIALCMLAIGDLIGICGIWLILTGISMFLAAAVIAIFFPPKNDGNEKHPEHQMD